MAIQVGNSYVSESAYAQAKMKIESEQNANSGVSTKSKYLASLQSKFQGWNVSTNTQAYSGKGLNNIGISSKILGEMANDPDKRLEYEALMIDCQDATKSLASAFQQKGLKLASHGFIIGADGGLSSWGVIESGDSNKKNAYNHLPKDDKKSWSSIIMDSFANSGEKRQYDKYSNSGVDFKA